MSVLWAALIAAGTAILISWLTHYFERRRRRIEYDLKWLEERFVPALNYLSSVDAILSAVPNTMEERTRTSETIGSIIVGETKENNAWTIALLLDPEQTGLGDLVFSVMAYGRIRESEQAFTDYQARVHLALRELAREFRRERQAIASGKSLQKLITERKSEADERVHSAMKMLDTLRGFSGEREEIPSILHEIERRGLRGADLKWMFNIVSNSIDRKKRPGLEELRKECRERGWID